MRNLELLKGHSVLSDKQERRFFYMSIIIREIRLRDLPVVAEMMHEALEPFYGGDHRAHAKRIVETATEGGEDRRGHFSAAQIMYVAESENNQILGLLNFVVKHQGTLKISPLIVREMARGRGVGNLLFQKVLEYAQQAGVRQIYCTVSAKNKSALGYFQSQGFIQAGMAQRHYRSDTDEVMLYKVVEHHGLFPKEQIISVLPLTENDKPQVRFLILERLTPFLKE
ncbi:hypothetical protein A3C91_03870 [Candidatus Azambacteria bacterium RIFCSPHIGHO2_02_FULL_52_12]|uniref:N-acetyltransferase domain-containing protein n=1 Tax=Candidatus Azambacteria bacterium RIFCSPLOWO2_01_FULL_46_25 TaxID=1797298 RepID=A0A1F5BTU4_9BACT|nr:MAG: hypothetical protein A3C91_03870 [Candidatus Azambacteria bacterium RIFCSPHIGHO2_02_FULL_52_12]OGD33996.1 MAG: hypothetical protein A2988_00725 [Candidatus Azambacteria bacterium RIFCSPLOWO2_01_FULL_46_25]OGD37197.1 MAG: hypothetical protein A2850_02535 [Candidatus Azambacteria bacterium RIFCSPHIGHO2_01_FULL_51_74]